MNRYQAAGLLITSIDCLSNHGMSNEEIYNYIAPRSTLANRRRRNEPLTREESNRAMRFARIPAIAEEVFGNDAKAARWLSKPEARLGGHRLLDMLGNDFEKTLTAAAIINRSCGLATHTGFLCL
jgi:putative toxin-antitoxin system antitoxin component (TIGR02293 family)